MRKQVTRVFDELVQNIKALSHRQLIVAGAVAGVVVIGVSTLIARQHPSHHDVEFSSQSKRVTGRYQPTDLEWANLAVEPVEQRSFRAEHVTEGKIAVDEDSSTPIFSPYSGRVTKLLVKPGDKVERGQPLFLVEATDAVQAQNDFITASSALNKARSALNLAQIVDKRQRELFEGKAAPLKEVQNARAGLDAAENDVQSAQVALEAARNRLRILGKTDQEIADFQGKGIINAATPIFSPISGTVVQRKVGPGQYIGSGSSDPVFVIGDLSTVWLIAYVRESDAFKIVAGQDVSFTVPADPEHTYSGKINYVAATLDPATHRLAVRATVQNPGSQLKPEMFANVSIFTDTENSSVAVPREALIYEGSTVRVWVAHDDKSIELRPIKTGLISGRMIQAVEGLTPGEQVVTRGSLFIDRAAVGS